MRAKKLFILLLSVSFLVVTVGLAVAAEEKKMAAKVKMAEGTVKSVSDTSLVIEGKDKKELSFAIGEKAVEGAKKVKAGDMVRVSYTEAEGKMVASKVTKAKMAEKKAANPCAAKK